MNRVLFNTQEEGIDTIEVLVSITCTECLSTYILSISDIIDIAVDGKVKCKCQAEIRIPIGVRLGFYI